MIVLDKYSAHKSQMVADERPLMEAANVHLVYLPAYCPERSAIEPVWNDVKRHQLPTRNFARVRDLNHAVEAALARKAHHLQHAATKTTKVPRLLTWSCFICV
jgi:putative transposase